ncbi:hypothetical protein FIBSPDRAFT_403317 [Athelia psychrophila]|uniref:Uncharacterized protein n=1 Tax=Athelia psychrophila TaxID=1759441 RepID=A0A166NJB7_9AGAM|nr:hypothetical protein FIBSPDRAFT_403317 [Fibularhizoctonia sp. CBS 109695]
MKHTPSPPSHREYYRPLPLNTSINPHSGSASNSYPNYENIVRVNGMDVLLHALPPHDHDRLPSHLDPLLGRPHARRRCQHFRRPASTSSSSATSRLTSRSGTPRTVRCAGCLPSGYFGILGGRWRVSSRSAGRSSSPCLSRQRAYRRRRC